MLVCGSCIPQLVCANVPLSSLSLLSSLPPVVTELKQAGLITNAQCRGLDEISGVVWAQSGKSPEVVAKTADVLDKHGFEEESRLLEGRQSAPHPFACVIVVQWSLLMMATSCHPLLSTDSCP